MNTMKVTKWFGFSLLGLVLLTSLLALSGLWAAGGILGRFSQVNPIQSEGKQMDVSIPGQKLADTVHDIAMGLGRFHLIGSKVVFDPSCSGGCVRISTSSGSSAGDPANGGRLILTGGINAQDPTKGGHFILTGGAIALDPSGRRG